MTDTAQEVQQWGRQEMYRIGEQIEGRCGIYDQAAGLWAWCVWNAGDTNVLDIGAAFGASAILAARVKQQYGLGGSVCTIDDWSANGKWQSSEAIVKENAERLGVQVGINTVPDDFGAVLIDGGHDGKQPLNDWRNYGRDANWVMFHDTDLPGVRHAVAEAKHNGNFVLAADRHNSTVFRRIHA